MDKSILKSKTFWVNITAALAPLFPGVGGYILKNPEVWTTIFAVANIVLRFFTQEKVKLV